MKIRIDGLEVPAIVGVRKREREIPQTLLVDIEFDVPPPEHDGLDATVDYSAVAEFVCEHIQAGAISPDRDGRGDHRGAGRDCLRAR